MLTTQLELPFLHLESFVPLLRQCRPEVQGGSFTEYLRPCPREIPEKHRILFSGKKPIIDITDGYFNLEGWLTLRTGMPEYFWNVGGLSCVQQVYDLPMPTECVDYRCLGNDMIFWRHPYLLMLYLHIFDEKISEYHACDKQLIRDTYETCIALGGKDYFKEFEHARIEYDIKLNPFEILFFNQRFWKNEETYQPRKGCVYLIRQNRSRIFKIGMSSDPQQRLLALQGANPHPLTLLYTWHVSHAYEVEHELHAMFSSVRQQGEWFALSVEQEAELIIFMEQYKTQYKESPHA